MLLEIDQREHALDVSYLNKQGNKAIMQFPIDHYTQWHISTNGISIPGYIDISGRPVCKCVARSFRTFDLLEFFKNQPKAIQDELFAYREANLVASDIETEIGDRFPKPELAEMPVNAISCVDSNMNIVIYTTKQCQGQITAKHMVKAKYGQDTDAYPELHQCYLTDVVKYYRDIAESYRDKTVTKFYNFDGQVYEIAMQDIEAFAQGYVDRKVQELTDASGEHSTLDLLTTTECNIPTGKWFRDEYVETTVVEEVNYIIREQVGHLIAPHEKIDAKILQFDTEKEMLDAYFSNVVRFAAVLAFWNGDGFDKPYLFNRCNQLGIPVAKGSITNEVASMTGGPKHTIFVDYMFLIDKYDRRIKNKESMKLDYISYRLLGKGKLPYRGTLKELSENDIPGFLAYNAIDSILVQLIHRQLNLMSTLYGFSQVCKLPLAKANSQVAQTESLIALDTLDMLDTEGVELPEKPNTGNILVAAHNPFAPPRRKYDGGHCKEPHKHVAKWNACIDFSGLYPSVHRSCNLSIENIIGNLRDYSTEHQKLIIDSPNYFVSVNNNVYKNDRAYAYKRIQIYLRAKRDYHKARMNKHLSLQQPFIEYALWERGLFPEKANFDKDVQTLPWTVYIEDKVYTPDLVHLNNPGDQEGYEHHRDFLWFLFHENLRQGFFEMNMQVAFKLVANSLYGATANEFNTFRNCDVADDTTAEGRNSIIAAEKIINNWMNFEWSKDHDAHKFLLEAFPDKCTKLVEGDMPALPIKDRIMYIDTDSLYIEYIDLLENCGIDITDDELCIDFFVALYDGYKRVNEDGSETYVKGYLGQLVNKRLHAMVNGRHGDSMQKFDLEHIAQAAIFRKKKSYMKTSDWVDGRKYSYVDAYKHLKCTGFSLARSFQSEKCRETARKAIIEIMQGKWPDKEAYLNNMLKLWQDFQTWSIEDISKRLSIRRAQYDKLVLGLEPYPQFGLRCLPQYRGAAWHNWHLRKRNLTAVEQDINDGFVCFYIDVFGNPFAYRIFELPEWHPEPDKVIQFYKLLGDTIRDVAIFYGIVCPLPLTSNNSIESDGDEDD